MGHRGISNKRQGNQWEHLFERSALRRGIAITRIHDGCRRVGRAKLIPMRQICDWICTYQKTTLLLDTKTVESGETFAYSHVNFDQINGIMLHVLEGAQGGYVVYFRDVNKIVFFHALKLKELLPRSSLSIDQGEFLGCLEDNDLRRMFGTV